MAPLAANGPMAPAQMGGGGGGNIQALMAQIAGAKEAIAEGAERGTRAGQVMGVKEFSRYIQEGVLGKDKTPQKQLDVAQKTLKHLEEKLAKEIAKAMPRGIALFGP